MPVQPIMSMAAAGFAILGGLALFAPRELAWRLGAPALSALLLQLLAAAWLSLAAMNWIGRRAVYGGIYGRGIVTANFSHGFIGATVLTSSGLRTGFGTVTVGLAVLFGIQAFTFGWMLMTSPKLPDTTLAGTGTRNSTDTQE